MPKTIDKPRYYGLGKMTHEFCRALCNNSNIVTVIDNNTIDPDCPEELMYKSIFPFKRVVDTVEESGTYIAVRANAPEYKRHNQYLLEAELWVWIVVEQRNMSMSEYGLDMTKTDYLASQVEEVIESLKADKKATWIGDLVKSRDTEDAVDYNHMCRILKFNCSEINIGEFK